MTFRPAATALWKVTYRPRKLGLAKSISRADTLLSFLTYSRRTITMSLFMYSECPLYGGRERLVLRMTLLDLYTGRSLFCSLPSAAGQTSGHHSCIGNALFVAAGRKLGLAKSISRADTLLSFLTYSRHTITMSLFMYSECPLCNVYAEGAVSLKAIQLSAIR